MEISWFGDFHFVWTSSIWNNRNMISFETLSQVTCFTNLSLILIANIHFCLDTAMETLSLMRLNNIGVWISLHLNKIRKSKNICNRFGNNFFLLWDHKFTQDEPWLKVCVWKVVNCNKKGFDEPRYTNYYWLRCKSSHVKLTSHSLPTQQSLNLILMDFFLSLIALLCSWDWWRLCLVFPVAELTNLRLRLELVQMSLKFPS